MLDVSRGLRKSSWSPAAEKVEASLAEKASNVLDICEVSMAGTSRLLALSTSPRFSAVVSVPYASSRTDWIRKSFGGVSFRAYSSCSSVMASHEAT